ncbi:hypothetical protein Tco_0267944 [Tanacetum coccineum]
MNPQENQQVAARDEKWVPSTERVKISSTNIRLETTMPQKEETFQVVIDIIKNSTCFKAFTIFVDVPEIFMQQFWSTIKKVKDFESYEFFLANKKCIVDAEVFKKIMDIYPRVEGEEFIPVQDDDDTLTFLTDLGYKGPLYKHTNMFVDHMHQPWRTLATILNKCLSGKIASNDKLRKSRIDILWGMFYRDNVDYPELIWEDFAFQIDHRKEKKSRCETMPFPRFTKKSKGKGLQGKKTVDVSQETVDVSEEFEPKPVKRRMASRRVVKKKVTIFVDDNINRDPDVALELGKSISITEAEEEEAARQVYATHARIVTKSVPKPAKKKTGSRSTESVVIEDTPSSPKLKPAISKPKFKGVQSLTLEEQEAEDVMQALKESKKTSRRHPGTGGSSEGTGRIPRVPDESTVVSATLSEGTGTKPWVPNKENVSTEEKVILEWGSEQESEFLEEDPNKGEDIDWIDSEEDDENKDDTDDDKSIDLEMTNDEETNDEVLQAKADAEKIKEANDDSKKAELPPISSSLSISLGFGDQFLKLSFDTSLIGTPSILTPVQETPLAVPVTNLPPLSVSTIPPTPLQQTTTSIPPPPIKTDAPIITSAVPESDALFAIQLRVVKLEKDVFELKKINHSAKALANLMSQVPTVVKQYLGSKIAPESSKIQTSIINLEQESKKSASEILKIKKVQVEKQKMLKYTIKSTDKAALKEYDQKCSLYQTMHENKSFNRNPDNHILYHALMEALIEDENAIDKGVASIIKDHKRKHDDDDDDDDEDQSSKKPSTTRETPKDKAPSKGSKTGKSASAKEPAEEPIAEVVMDDAGEDVVHDDDQPQYTSEAKTAKTPNLFLFKQPPRPPTPDLEWNKHQVVFGQPEQPWFNQMVSATKDPLTFNDLMSTPIDFSKYVLNFLKIDNCFNALTNKLDWNNPEGDRYPFDLSKPLPLQGRPSHPTVAADYFFNNDLEYLKSSDLERTPLTLHALLLAVPPNSSTSFLPPTTEVNHRDLQLGVESYQKKLNITAPQQTFLEIEFKELYTLSYKPPGTKTELTLEQTQQGVSDEVLNIRVMPKSIHNDDGNPSRANIKQALW